MRVLIYRGLEEFAPIRGVGFRTRCGGGNTEVLWEKVKIASGNTGEKWGTRVIGDYGNSRATYFAGV